MLVDMFSNVFWLAQLLKDTCIDNIAVLMSIIRFALF